MKTIIEIFTLVGLLRVSTEYLVYLHSGGGLVAVLSHELLHPVRSPHHPLYLHLHLGHEAGQVGVLLPDLAQGPGHLGLELQNIIVQPLRGQITADLNTEIINTGRGEAGPGW